MGRIFEKRKDRMFARWSKMAKAFTKLGKEISIAVKLGGPEPASNPRLRMAIQNARTLNMPKDRIEAAIKRASSKGDEAIHEIAYEGYGPHGVAVFVEAATGNQTRTAANVRNLFSRYGGNLAAVGAVEYIFTRKGIFKVALPKGGIPEDEFDELELAMIDHGLEDLFEAEDGSLLIYSAFSSFGDMQRFLEERGLEVLSAGLERVPQNYIELSPEGEAEVMKLVEMLEDDDDVQHVYHNLKH